MLARMLGVAWTALVLMGAAHPASTCLFVPTVLHEIDAQLANLDRTAPGRPEIIQIQTFRRKGMTCTRASCVANSCGDTGTIRLELAVGADEETPPEQMGYRLELIRGELPASLQGVFDMRFAGTWPVYLRPTFEEVALLDATLVAIAVDAAGNESQPSEPFTIAFGGCTLAAIGDECEDALDPDTDLSAAFDRAVDASIDAPPQTDGSISCALGSAPSGHGSIVWGAAILSFIAARVRRGGCREGAPEGTGPAS